MTTIRIKTATDVAVPLSLATRVLLTWRYWRHLKRIERDALAEIRDRGQSGAAAPGRAAG